MRLTDEQVELYSRQIILREVGGIGQAALRAARVRVIGTGAAAEACTSYLVGAGIGTVEVEGRDAVDEAAHALPLPAPGRRTADASVERIATAHNGGTPPTCDVVLDLELAAVVDRRAPARGPTSSHGRRGTIILRCDAGGGLRLALLPTDTGCPACTRPSAEPARSGALAPGRIASASAGALAALVCCRWLLGIGADAEARALALHAGSGIWTDDLPPLRVTCPRGCPPPAHPV